MPMSVLIRSYSGEILGRSIHRSLGQVCRSARDRALPMLGDVDPYDDTVFNRSQIPRLLSEVEVLQLSAGASQGEAISELVELANYVLRKPHRYLVFSGD